MQAAYVKYKILKCLKVQTMRAQILHQNKVKWKSKLTNWSRKSKILSMKLINVSHKMTYEFPKFNSPRF